MKELIIKVCAIAVLMSCIVIPALLYAGQDEHQHSHHGKQNPQGENPLMEEMIILDGVFREVVSAVSLGDGARVHKALEAMHGTMEKTHEGVHSGSVKIPRNSDRIDEFVHMDKEFHRNLEALAHAAHADNQQEMLALTKKLLDGCVKCHRTFRK
jgi:cytochrome c556